MIVSAMLTFNIDIILCEGDVIIWKASSKGAK